MDTVDGHTAREGTAARLRWAHACEDAARALVRIDRHLQARDLLLEALRIYEDLGEFTAAERVRTAMDPRARRSSDAGWDALTRTELTVAVLASEGLSTAGIAERLVVSPRTVQTHLRNIYGKLGFNQRARLAAEVVSRRLSAA